MKSVLEPGSMKLYKCSSCPKRYSRAFGLRDHQRIHTGEQPYTCSHTTCDKTFISKDLCRIHEATHCQDRKHTCAKCGKRFLRSCTLRRHERQVHAWHRAKDCDRSDEGNTASSDPEGRHTSGSLNSSPEIEALNNYDQVNPQTISRSAHHASIADTTAPVLEDTCRRIVNGTHSPDVSNDAGLLPESPSAETIRSATLDEISVSALSIDYSQFPAWYEMFWFMAAEMGNATILRKFCIEGRVNIEARQTWGHCRTALDICASTGHHNALNVLLDLGANVNSFGGRYGFAPLHYALGGKRRACLLTLIARGANVDLKDSQGMTVLMAAAEYDVDIDVFRAMLYETKNIDEKNNTGLRLVHFAAQKRDCSYLALILDHGANVDAPNDSGQTALHLAGTLSRDMHIRLTQEYFDSLGRRKDQQQKSFYDLPLRVDDEDIKPSMELLLSRGADVNVQDHEGNTPLMTWFEDVSAPHTAKFTRYGGDINVVNRRDETALDIALRGLDIMRVRLRNPKFSEREFSVGMLRRRMNAIAELLDLEAMSGEDLIYKRQQAIESLGLSI